MSEHKAACGECDSLDLSIIPTDHGWKVTCGNGHEIFPIPGEIIVVRGKNVERQ